MASNSSDRSTQAGYHAWAKPLVRLMERSRLVTSLVRPFGTAWAQHMAYVMGMSDEDNVLGRFLDVVGVPLNRMLGKCRI